MNQELIESFSDGIATLTMNRPEARNALSDAVLSALIEALPRLAADPSVRLVVLTGAGGAFSAGGDVKGMARLPERSRAEGSKELRASMEISRWLHEMPKPTLAVIPGAVAGGSLSMALACDLRVAVRTAKLTTAFAKVGLSGDYGGTYFLPQLVGAAKARELYFTADVIMADEALALGILNHVYDPDVFEVEAHAFATKLASLPTGALGLMKKNLNAAARGSLSDVMDLEAEHIIQSFGTEDHKQAVKAFVEKRQPVFKSS